MKLFEKIRLNFKNLIIFIKSKKKSQKNEYDLILKKMDKIDIRMKNIEKNVNFSGTIPRRILDSVEEIPKEIKRYNQVMILNHNGEIIKHLGAQSVYIQQLLEEMRRLREAQNRCVGCQVLLNLKHED